MANPAKKEFDFEGMEAKLLERLAEAVPEAKVARAKSGSYFRLLVGTTTLAYVWRSPRKGLIVDVYADENVALPKEVKPGRGRARVAGRMIEVNDAKAAITAVDALKIAADAAAGPSFAETSKEAKPHPKPSRGKRQAVPA